MGRAFLLVVRVLLPLLTLARMPGLVWAQTPTTAPAATALVPRVTDAEAAAAIDKAVKYLYSQQEPRQGYFACPKDEPIRKLYLGGPEALVVLSLLEAGQPPADERIVRALAYLNSLQPGHTYTRAVRAMVYARLGGEDNLRRLAEDIQWLVKEQQPRTGGWGYGPRSLMTRQRPLWADGSNSQLALLALRQASEAGLPYYLQTLRSAEKFWASFRNGDGGWGYQPRVDKEDPQRAASHGSMTAAGVACYFIFADTIGIDGEPAYRRGQPQRPGKLAFAEQIAPGVRWLAEHYAVDKVPGYIWTEQPSQHYYYLLLLQRAGDAAGLRTFGDHPYHLDVADVLCRGQKSNGSWGDSGIDTAFALMSLVKARAPVVIHRLRVGDESPNPRDAANLAGWMSRKLGTHVAWRMVEADDAKALAECPLLYVNFASGQSLPDNLSAVLAEAVKGGRTVLIQAPAGGAAVTLAEAMKKLFPQYEVKPLPDDHPAFGLRFKVGKAARPAILGVGDASRTRVFILTDEVSLAWHQGRWIDDEDLFALGGNIALAAAGGKLPPGQIAVGETPAPPPPVRGTISLARVRHKGDFNVCPQAAARLNDALARSLSVGVKELAPVDPSKDIPADVPLLWMTGNDPPGLDEPQKANLRKYLQAGGTLLIDPATGRKEFADGGAALAGELVGQGNVAAIKPDDPLMTGSFAGGVGAGLTKVRLLGADGEPPAPPAPARLLVGRIQGRAAVIVSEAGLACSIEGLPAVGNRGYVPEDARKIALNVLLYAAAGRKGD